MKRLLVFTLLVSLFVANVKAQNEQKEKKTYSFTVKQSVDFAVLNQVNIRNSQLEEQIAEQKVRDLLSVGLPQANANISYQYNAQIATALMPVEFSNLMVALGVIGPENAGKPFAAQFGVKNNLVPAATLTQLVFDGTYFVGLKAAREYVKLARVSTQKSKVDLAATITKAYYAVLVNERRLELMKTNIGKLEKTLADTKTLQKNGMAEQIDIDRLQVSLNNLLTEIDKVTQLVELSKYLLKFQMGMEQDAVLTLTEPVNEMDFAAVLAGLPEKVSLDKRIEFRQLQQAQVLENYNTKRLKMGYYPSVAAFLNWQYQGQSNKFDFFTNKDVWFPATNLGLRINIPIFDGFKKDAQIQQSKLALRQLENNEANLRIAADFEFNNAKITLSNAVKTLEIQKRNMQLAEEVYKVAQTKYAKGVGTNLEVVNAETDMKQAQMNYYNTMLDAYLARVDIEKALGTLYE